MAHDFQLTKMIVIDGAPNQVGNRLLASFDMHIAGLHIGGCVLVERADGRAITNGPRGKTASGHKAQVLVQDDDLKQAVTERAAKLYEGFTGRALREVGTERSAAG